MSKFWFGLKLALSFSMAFSILLWIFWNPLSSYGMEWYFKKKVEKELGGVLQIENVAWEDGVLLFIHPTLSAKISSESQDENSVYFQAERIAISYDYSLWHREVNFKLMFSDSIFTMNSKTEMLLKAMILKQSSKLVQ